MRRRGYNQYEAKYKAKYKKSLIFLVLCMLFTVFCGYGYARADKESTRAMTLQGLFYAQAHDNDKLVAENQELKDKMDRSSKIVTSDTTKALVRLYLQKYFGKDAQRAEKVFTCESNLNPNALNDKNTNHTMDRGIAQINSIHAANFEKVTGLKYDIGAHDTDANIKFAKHLYDSWGSSFQPWVCRHVLED